MRLAEQITIREYGRVQVSKLTGVARVGLADDVRCEGADSRNAGSVSEGEESHG